MKQAFPWLLLIVVIIVSVWMYLSAQKDASVAAIEKKALQHSLDSALKVAFMWHDSSDIHHRRAESWHQVAITQEHDTIKIYEKHYPVFSSHASLSADSINKVYRARYQ